MLVRRWRKIDKFEICFGGRLDRILLGYGCEGNGRVIFGF